MTQHGIDGTRGGITRRGAIAGMGALGAATLIGSTTRSVRAASLLTADDLGWNESAGEYVLPPLPYAEDALEPHIDAATMKVHHGKHHAGYVAGANRALKNLAQIRESGETGLIEHWQRQLNFHLGGHVNHTLFWAAMAPEGAGGGGEPEGALAVQISRDFGSFEAFTAHFRAASAAVEGSGWGWLAWEPVSRRLMVMQMHNQQNGMSAGVVPLLGVDVWEHAYYLRYQNRRPDYVAAFLKVAKWAEVARRFDLARG
jgi:Fe-Mn family superoxide dismutase